MNDRDCETCVNKRHGMCSRWSCYYMNREQVVQALKSIQEDCTEMNDIIALNVAVDAVRGR